MKETLQAGLEKQARIEVDEGRTIAFMGPECRVYSTPMVLHDVEVASQQLIKEHLDDAEDTVGMTADIQHLAATPLGMWVDVSVRITKVEGRKVDLEFDCRDAEDNIARGTHSRFVINRQKTADNIQAKAARNPG